MPKPYLANWLAEITLVFVRFNGGATVVNISNPRRFNNNSGHGSGGTIINRVRPA